MQLARTTRLQAASAWTHRAALWLALALACLSATVSTAQTIPTDPVETAIASLTTAGTDVRAIDTQLDRPLTTPQQRELKDRLAAAQKVATADVAALEDQIALVDARITQLGPITPGLPEAADISAQRRLLTQQRATIDSAIKRGRLMTIEAAQLGDELDATLAAQRGRELAQRQPSIVTPTFWGPLLAALPADLTRLARLADAGLKTAYAGARGQGWLAVAGIILAVVLLWPARLKLRAIGQRYAIDNVPGHRVRRSGLALWRVVVGTATSGFAAVALVWGLHGSGMVDPRWEPVVGALVPAAFVTAFITALSGALLLRGQPSWRLLPIDDGMAVALRPWTWALSALALIDPLVSAMNDAARASRAAHVASDTVEAIATLVVAVGILVTVSWQRRRARAAHDDAHRESAKGALPGGAAHPLTAFVILIVAAASIAAAVSILAGYLGFALWLMRAVIFWPGIVIGALYILLSFADDVATSLFAATSRPGVLIGRSIGVRPSAIDQFGVVLSGVLRIALVVLGIGAILTPFGAGLDSFSARLGALSDGITIGQVTIAPGAVLRSLLVLGVGLALAKGFLRWLNTSYLPTTELDDSARNSVGLVARYIGISVAVLWGLAALGIGLERIALLLSALSVGIGFGLQAITQNFISGLILLAERPVKIGDLVRIGTDEGDVRRIRVRSTEIELADHSTLIVPNSKLITETVLNKTLASPLGRMQIQFTVPLGTDPARVRAIMLQAFTDQEGILDTPAPAVFIDGIANDRIGFNCFAHVAGPRDVYSARSAVLMQILQHFAAEGIDLGTPAARVELIQSEVPEALRSKRADAPNARPAEAC